MPANLKDNSTGIAAAINPNGSKAHDVMFRQLIVTSSPEDLRSKRRPSGRDGKSTDDFMVRLRDELRRELAAPAEGVAPRLVDDIQLLVVKELHFSFLAGAWEDCPSAFSAMRARADSTASCSFFCNCSFGSTSVQ